MSSLVLDTHALIWFLSGSDRLSPNAAAAIQEAAKEGHPLIISSVSVVEVIYLTEKGRIEVTHLPSLLSALRRPDANVLVQPFDLDTAETMRKISRDAVVDMPDRMIAATALQLNLPLITRDAQIRAASLQTIW